jgi:penicillin-binding protein 1C
VAYFYKPHHANFKEIPKWLPDCQSASQPMEMIYPRNFTNIFIPRELDGKEGSAIFELAHQNKAAKVFWYVDGDYVGQTEETHQIAIQSSIGSHEMYVVDESGNYLSVAFNVIKR